MMDSITERVAEILRDVFMTQTNKEARPRLWRNLPDRDKLKWRKMAEAALDAFDAHRAETVAKIVKEANRRDREGLPSE